MVFPAVHEHLLKVEKAIKSAKPLLNQHEYPDDYRTVTVIGFIAQLIEHHGPQMDQYLPEAVLVLIMQDHAGCLGETNC